MVPVAVGTLHDQDIATVAYWHGVTDDGDVRPADISAEDQTAVLAGHLIVDVKDDMGAAQHMTGIEQSEINPGEELVGTAVWLASDAAKFITGIVVPVDGGFSAFSGV